MAEHFVQPPHWEWYIIGYFFLAGIAGGSYALATMLRLWGSSRDDATIRIGYLIAFPLCVVCGILLTIDLGQPLRFFHMLINTTPGAAGLNFKAWSPISVGSWALLVFSAFAFVSYLQTVGGPRNGGNIAWNVLGSIVALFLASYTGVVLSVSNQPIWSDSWAIGGLFVASALSGSAALLSAVATNAATERRLQGADGYFALLELALIVVFLFSLNAAGTLGRTMSGVWLILWLLVFASLLPPLMGLVGGRRAQLAAAGGSLVTSGARSSLTASLTVLLGVFLMRCAVILSAQF